MEAAMEAADLHDDTAADVKDVFSRYACTTIDRGMPHPGDIAEPASLRCVPPLLGPMLGER